MYRGSLNVVQENKSTPFVVSGQTINDFGFLIHTTRKRTRRYHIHILKSLEGGYAEVAEAAIAVKLVGEANNIGSYILL